MSAAKRFAAVLLSAPLCLAVLPGSCTPPPAPNPPPQPVVDAAMPVQEAGIDAPVDSGAKATPDAPPMPNPGTTCAEACAILQWLGCPEGNDTPRGQPCTTRALPDGGRVIGVCEQTQAAPNFTLPTWCVGQAKSIAEVRKCPGVKCATK